MARAKCSAGVLIHRVRHGVLEVLLAHPGGPFWQRKDLGSWSIPKGELEPGEEPLAAAVREVREEIGIAVPPQEAQWLGEVQQAGGKRVQAWHWRGEVEPDLRDASTFEMEWPPKSGKVQRFAEVDRAEWFPLAQARQKILAGQVPLLDALALHEGLLE